METLVIRGDMLRNNDEAKASIFDTEKNTAQPGIQFDEEGNVVKHTVVGDRETIMSVLRDKKKGTVIKFDRNDMMNLRILRNNSILKHHPSGQPTGKKSVLI